MRHQSGASRKFKNSTHLSLFLATVLLFWVLPGISLAQKTPAQLAGEITVLNQKIEQAGAQWRAGITSLSYLSKEEMILRLGVADLTITDSQDSLPIYPTASQETPPTQWDWRDKDGHNWMTSVKDQGSCGSCVAFGTCAAMEASFKILLNDPLINIDLSEQHLFSCGADMDNTLFSEKVFGCEEGWTTYHVMPLGIHIGSMPFALKFGVPDESCNPYQAVDYNCSQSCSNWMERVYKINAYNLVSDDGQDITAIKKAIMNHPVTTSMKIYEDFQHYTEGIYRHVSGDFLGNHCIVILGWNDNNQIWICKNSWGTNWGENGYFRIEYNDSEIGKHTVEAHVSDIPTSGVMPMVDNVEVSQNQNDPRFVDVSYDVWHPEEEYFNVRADLSMDGGTTFPYHLYSFIGDIGNYVPKGKERKFTWNAFKEFPGVMMENAVIRVYANSQTQGLFIENLSSIYSPPYMLDFDFTLRDYIGNAVVTDPSRFEVTCMECIIDENCKPISPSETGYRLSDASYKQMKCFLVMDYTASMASLEYGDADGDRVSDAIEKMEESSIDFIDRQKQDAQIGIYEFHREDKDPIKVSGLSLNKNYLKKRVMAIRPLYVLNFHAGSRCWDAIYAALEEFSSSYQFDELRFIIFLSDGRDESSTHKPDEIIDLAQNRRVKIYSIGFGEELKQDEIDTLRNISNQTSGMFYPAETVKEMGDRFRLIMNDVKAQYTLRWVTLKRSQDYFYPYFNLSIAKQDDGYWAARYYPPDFSGDVLDGVLRFIGSPVVDGKTTVFLRSGYTPRNVRKIRIYIRTEYPYTVDLISPSLWGLCPPGWTLKIIDESDFKGKWIEVASPEPSNPLLFLKYGSFGPILKFNFSGLNNLSQLFDQVRVDNTIYEQTGGQRFSLKVDW